MKYFAPGVCTLPCTSLTQVKAPQTKRLLSNIVFNKRGITPERILNCFNFLMFLSTRVCSDQYVKFVDWQAWSSRLEEQGGLLECE